MSTSPITARVSIRAGSADGALREPLTVGVPLPPGRLIDPATLVVVADEARPTDARVLERWPDGSARWVLVDTIVDVPAAGRVIEIRDDRPRPVDAPALTLTTTTGTATIAAAGLELALDLSHAHLISRCTLHGVPAMGGTAPIVQLTGPSGVDLPVSFSRLEVEHAGRLRAVLRVVGEAHGADGARLEVRLRLTFFAAAPVIGVELGLLNPRAAVHDGGFWQLGDAGSVLLRSAALVVGAPGPLRGVRVQLEEGAEERTASAPLAITQHASGGEQWQSRVHVNSAGTVPLTTRGYTATLDGSTVSGLRSRPRITVAHAHGALAVVSRRFWEVFPKGLDVEADGGIRVWSLPAAAEPHEVQGGERCDHDVWFAFGPADLAVPAWCAAPSTALPEIAAVALAERLPALAAVEAGVNTGYEQLVSAAVDGDDSFLAKRERIDEYGWRHFGDLYADHENGTVPGRLLVSHYNNQYDAVLGLTLQALRRDDHRWWRLAGDLARHVTRTDIYWTTEDRAAYNGGLFWHTAHYTDAGTSTHRTYPRDAGLPGGGPSNEHCYAHGLLLHHLLTGDAVSREAVIRLADWVIAMDDGRLARWPLPLLSHAPTGAASATYSEDYHGPGRGAGHALLALLDGHRLSGDTRYLDAAEALIRRVIHPQDDLAARDLLNVEGRWSYTVCLQALGRYLWVVESRGRDEHVEYARACLLHYARWMAAHEYFYLDKPEVLEFPTETWAAQDMRKAEVLYLAAYHAVTADERASFLARARYFHDRSVETLAASPQRTRTRPVVLLMQNGYSRPWFERVMPDAPLHPAWTAPWPPPVAFEPQKRIAMRRLKLAAAAMAVAGLAGIALLARWLLA